MRFLIVFTRMVESRASCLICGKPGIERRGETLPDKSILIKVVHDDGSACRFSEYPTFSTFLDSHEKKREPRLMKCPVCKNIGRIGYYRPNKEKEFHLWRYYIKHEPVGGYWGIKQKVKRYRRCYMKTENQKNVILKKLGYIS
jgi:hypothetical protein